MKKDLPINIVEDIGIAVVLENDSPNATAWNVYLINAKDHQLEHAMVTSKGYGQKEGIDVQTSTLRHYLGDIPASSGAKIEAIDPAVFGLTNEYWLSYYINGTIYDKKYIFLQDSIVDENLIRIPYIGKSGVMIGGMN